MKIASTQAPPSPPTTKEIKALVALYISLPPIARDKMITFGTALERLSVAYSASGNTKKQRSS